MNLMLNSSEGWFLIVDLFILMFSLFGNQLALYGVWKARFRLVGYRRFLISLVVGDLFLICVHIFDKANQIFVAESMSRCCRCATFFIRSLLLVGVFVNLFNLCGMSVDHYIGIVYPLRYRYMMRKRLARWALLFIWIGGFCCGFADTPFLAVSYYLDQSGIRSSPDFAYSFSADSSGSALIAQRLIAQSTSFMSPPNLTSYLLNQYSPADIAFYQEHTRRRLLRNNSVRHVRLPVLTAEFGPSPENQPDLYKTVELVTLMTTSKAIVKVKRPRQLINEIRNRSLGYYRVQHTSWCAYFSSKKKWLELVSGLCVLLSFAFIAAIYGRTFNRASTALNSRSIRKLTLTTCLLLGVFAICWLPFALVELVMGLSTLQNFSQAHSESLLIIHKIFYTFFLLNRIFDPIVYVARLPNVQRFLLRRFAACFPCLRGLHVVSEERSERNGDRITLHGSLPGNVANNQGILKGIKDDSC